MKNDPDLKPVLLIPLSNFDVDWGSPEDAAETAYYVFRKADADDVHLDDVERTFDLDVAGELFREAKPSVEAGWWSFPYGPYVDVMGVHCRRGLIATTTEKLAAAFRSLGFDILVCQRSPDDERSDVIFGEPYPLAEELQKAWDDILEWFVEHEAQPVVDSLRAPATRDEIELVERKLGHPLPDGLRGLYSMHNGQWEPEVNPMLPNSQFLPLQIGMSERNLALTMYFGSASEPVDRERVEYAIGPDGDPLLDEEYDRSWFCFGETQNFHTMVHLVTGRVFSFVRQDGFYLEAESFDQYLQGLADDLWNDRYVLAGDPELDGVEEEGFIYQQRHLDRVR